MPGPFAVTGHFCFVNGHTPVRAPESADSLGYGVGIPFFTRLFFRQRADVTVRHSAEHLFDNLRGLTRDIADDGFGRCFRDPTLYHDPRSTVATGSRWVWTGPCFDPVYVHPDIICRVSGERF